MRAGSPSGVPSAPGAGPSIRLGMPASEIIERRRRLRTGPPVFVTRVSTGGADVNRARETLPHMGSPGRPSMLLKKEKKETLPKKRLRRKGRMQWRRVSR